MRFKVQHQSKSENGLRKQNQNRPNQCRKRRSNSATEVSVWLRTCARARQSGGKTSPVTGMSVEQGCQRRHIIAGNVVTGLVRPNCYSYSQGSFESSYSERRSHTYTHRVLTSYAFSDRQMRFQVRCLHHCIFITIMIYYPPVKETVLIFHEVRVQLRCISWSFSTPMEKKWAEWFRVAIRYTN